MTSIAIIGAGSSGLAAAHTLLDAGYSVTADVGAQFIAPAPAHTSRDASYTVTLFEQTDDVGGRATTQQHDGFTYDSGAQYIKPGPVSTPFVTERFALPDLIDIHKPVWIFDQHGHIQEGDPIQNAEPKWNYASGLLALSHCMAAGLHISFHTTITRVQHTTTGWQLFGSAGQPIQPISTFDQLLITIPAPQAADLIENSSLAPDIQKNIVTLLRTARYNPLTSVMLGYAPAPQERPYYALVNTDRAHAISWLAWEHEKSPARAPVGTGLLIAQMAPTYSQQHMGTSDEEIIRDTAAHVAALIQEPLPPPIFTTIQRWPFALPVQNADAKALNTLTLPLGLAFCGDAFTGGRVHLAMEHGVEVAGQLINRC